MEGGKEDALIFENMDAMEVSSDEKEYVKESDDGMSEENVVVCSDREVLAPEDVEVSSDVESIIGASERAAYDAEG